VGQLPRRPFVLARRSDQLGGRLNAITNARVLAELLDLEFRFAWPSRSDHSVADPTELFDGAFLAEFELEPHTLDGLRCVTYDDFMAMTPAERSTVLDRSSRVFIEIEEPYVVLRPDAAEATTATRRYRRCFEELGWNDVARGLVDFAAYSATLEDLLGMHVRAGDVVTGGWRHTVTHQKYVPTAFVNRALTAFAAGGRRALLVSDSTDYVAYLRSWFPVLTPEELVPGYERLNETQRALADMLLLSRCNPIVGPSASAFSRLAANLGGAIVARTDSLVPAGEERECILSGVAGATELASLSELWRKLTAHDLCWLLDVFGDTLDLSKQHDLAAKAVRLDPEHCAALCRLGRIAALAGKRRSALKATTHAIAIGEQIDSHDDPLFEALATHIVVTTLAVRGRDADSGTETMHRAYDRLTRLAPYWFGQEEVLPRLSYLIDVAQTVSAQPFLRRQRLARSMRRDMRRPSQTIGWQTDGMAQHRARPLFDPLLRDLDRITRHVSHSLRVLGVDVPSRRPRSATL
jgi:hypothetical protein